MTLVIILCATIAVSGGFVVGVVVGFYAGRDHERHLAERRRPLAPHEVLAQLRGPLPSRPDPSLTERVERVERGRP